jgi:hypothetical protein
MQMIGSAVEEGTNKDSNKELDANICRGKFFRVAGRHLAWLELEEGFR